MLAAGLGRKQNGSSGWIAAGPLMGVDARTRPERKLCWLAIMGPVPPLK